MVISTAMLLGPGLIAQARAANFFPTAGFYDVDTTALTITGPDTELSGIDDGGVAVFKFDEVNIPVGVTLQVSGSRPFRLVASGNLTLTGNINGQGVDAQNFVVGPNDGGPGGGAGGTDFTEPGGGPGGGGVADGPQHGGGGGGFGGSGAAGGLEPAVPGTAGAGGLPYGDLNAVFQAGSGGGGGDNVGGGGGGGAIAVHGSFVRLTPGADIRVHGGDGAVGDNGASGGGSGGGIIIRGNDLQIEEGAELDAPGGAGGEGGCCGDGGGGAGGRIAYQFRHTILDRGDDNVEGGLSGTATSGGAFGHGGLSPDFAGAAGIVTLRQAATALTGAATSISPTAATLTGSVNPHSNATTYHFEYGSTTAYGSRVPSPDQPAGSDAENHAVSQSLTGLAPGTTYHYRIVATDSLGFTTRGADVAFTTPSPPVAPTRTDADADGVAKENGDCDDNDARRFPGNEEIPNNGVDEDCARGDAIARIDSQVIDSWRASRRSTKVRRLTVLALPEHSVIRLTCGKGRARAGCPFRTRTIEVANGGDKALKRKFVRRRRAARLKPGVVVQVRMTAPHHFGRVIRYRIRRGKQPSESVFCLPVGGTTPQAC